MWGDPFRVARIDVPTLKGSAYRACVEPSPRYMMTQKLRWPKFGSSPIIHDGMLIIQADVQKSSFLAALDVTTGKEICLLNLPQSLAV